VYYAKSQQGMRKDSTVKQKKHKSPYRYVKKAISLSNTFQNLAIQRRLINFHNITLINSIGYSYNAVALCVKVQVYDIAFMLSARQNDSCGRFQECSFFSIVVFYVLHSMRNKLFK